MSEAMELDPKVPTGEQVPAGEAASSGDDWSDLAKEFTSDALDPIETKGEEASAQTPAEPAAPVPQKAEVPPTQQQAQPQTPPTPQEPQQQAQAPTPPVQPDPQQPVAQTPEQQQQQQAEWQKLRESYVSEISKQYQMSKEDAEKFVLNPNEVIPRLAANLHANILQQAVSTVMQAMQQVLPQMVTQVQTQREATQTAEDQFFSRWPELKAHRDKVIATGRLFRSQNPNASMDEFIQQVGINSWLVSGLPPAGLVGKLNGGSQQQQPQQQVQQQPLRGFQPAAPGAVAPMAPQQASNPFEAMAIEMKEDFF